jgi:hypothetical protein
MRQEIFFKFFEFEIYYDFPKKARDLLKKSAFLLFFQDNYFHKCIKPIFMQGTYRHNNFRLIGYMFVGLGLWEPLSLFLDVAFRDLLHFLGSHSLFAQFFKFLFINALLPAS